MSNLTTYKQRETVLNAIDWEKVEAVFRLLGHTWYMSDGCRVPTPEELRAHGAQLLRDVRRDNSLSAGRLRASLRGGLLSLTVEAFDSMLVVGGE